jgi:hypothetical protein
VTLFERMCYQGEGLSPCPFLEAAAWKKEHDGHGHTCRTTWATYQRSGAQKPRPLTFRSLSWPSLTLESRSCSLSVSLSLSRSVARMDWCLKLPICEGCVMAAPRKEGRAAPSNDSSQTRSQEKVIMMLTPVLRISTKAVMMLGRSKW